MSRMKGTGSSKTNYIPMVSDNANYDHDYDENVANDSDEDSSPVSGVSYLYALFFNF